MSNLPFIGKTIERVVNHQLMEHLSAHGLLKPLQSSYRNSHSTETAVLKVSSDIMSYLCSGFSVALILLDLSAAFDTVNHHILLNRLEHSFGVQQQALMWFKSYIENRTQNRQVKGALSSPHLRKCGVPQLRLCNGSSFIHNIQFYTGWNTAFAWNHIPFLCRWFSIVCSIRRQGP